MGRFVIRECSTHLYLIIEIFLEVMLLLVITKSNIRPGERAADVERRKTS